MPQATPSEELVTLLDAMAQQTIGELYVKLGASFRAGIWKVLGDALVTWHASRSFIAWKVQDIPAGSFTTPVNGGMSTSPALAFPASTNVALRGGFALLRNGVDNMLYVTGTPAGAAQWTIDAQNRVVIFGNVTASGDTYRVRYTTAA